MGDVHAFAPFQIDYIFSDEDVNGFKPHPQVDKLIPCDQPAPVSRSKLER